MDTHRSYMSSNISPRSRTAGYEFRLLNYRQDLTKQEQNLKEVKPGVARISLAPRQPVDIEKKKTADRAANLDDFDNQ